MVDASFGRYNLMSLLGRGGMGEVWRAYDTATDRIVALKLLPVQWAEDDTFQQRFRREAQAAAQLNEPHVVPIHGYGDINGRLYVDMRLIEGRDLQSLIREGPLPPVRAVMIIEQVARALQAAHTIGLVHRDVKPSNILVGDFDFTYLIDFGIARGIDQTGFTNTGNVMGTWHYLAPERLSAGQTDTRSDVYALTCVLHECLTGERPFPGDTMERQVTAHLMAPPPRPSAITSSVPSTFDAVIATGMAKAPDDRYSTTMQLAEAAHNALKTPIARSPLPPPPEAEATQLASASYPHPGQAPISQYPSLFKSASTFEAATRPAQFSETARKKLLAAIVVVAAVLLLGGVLIFAGSRLSRPEQTPSAQTMVPYTSDAPINLSRTSTTNVYTTPVSALPSSAPPAPQSTLSARPSGDLGLSVPMSRPACDGTGIVVLGNATNPGSYTTEIQRLIDANPGSSYLRTDQACPSLRQSLNGNAIYAVYRVAGATEAEVCAAVRAAGGEVYGKWLDNTTDPSTSIRQTCF